MKKQECFIMTFLSLSIIWCVSAMAQPATNHINSVWTGTVRSKQVAQPALGDKAEVVFYSEWTLGESAGNVYPKKFTLSDSGTVVKLDARWDNGGNIPAGTYDVNIDIDGMPRTGTLRKLQLEKGTAYKIYTVFNAAKIAIPLATDGDQVVIFPAGTHDKYEQLGRLNNIPNELVINAVSSYTEKNPIYWLMPAGIPVDILRTFSSGETKWFTNYTALPESFVKDLP